MKSLARYIRSITPVPLRKGIFRVGEYFGFGLEMKTRFPSIEATLETLKKIGLRPGFCIDVGAYQGEWTAMCREAFPMTKVLMVEAQEAKRPILEQVVAGHRSDLTLEIALLGPTDGQTVQFTEMETGSSVYAESSPYSRVTSEKRTRRLDTLLSEGHFPTVDLLKLDVQGYELEILKGAPDTLSQVTAVLMEASLIPVNAGCPLIAEVIAFMDSAGFRLFDFCSQVRRPDGVLWQTDLLFLRASSPLVPQPCLNYENWYRFAGDGGGS